MLTPEDRRSLAYTLVSGFAAPFLGLVVVGILAWLLARKLYFALFT